MGAFTYTKPNRAERRSGRRGRAGDFGRELHFAGPKAAPYDGVTPRVSVEKRRIERLIRRSV